MLKTLGYLLFFTSLLFFALILIIPWFEFSKDRLAGTITILFIAAEVFFYLSLFLLGKSFYTRIKSKLKFWEKTTPEPASGEEQSSSPIND